MEKEEYFSVGKIVNTFGLQGQVVLQHSLGGKTNLTGLQVVMIEIRRNDLVPYFITNTKAKNESEVYITIEDITSKEKAQKLVSRPVWFKQTDFKKYVAKSSSLSMLGYTIFDNDTELSQIIEIINQPHQILAKIIHNEKEMLIPIHEAFIVKVDNDNKKVILNLPEGLLEIF
jgi:16S rRNA processing protein RimM